jgi:thiamine pyrophosphate-dependent acetolactate synthase large subunit-like protein
MLLVGAVGSNALNLIIVLSLANWARFARVVRSEALTLRQRDFVMLARSLGMEAHRITEPDDIALAIKRSVAGGKPVLLDVVVDNKV